MLSAKFCLESKLYNSTVVFVLIFAKIRLLAFPKSEMGGHRPNLVIIRLFNFQKKIERHL